MVPGYIITVSPNTTTSSTQATRIVLNRKTLPKVKFQVYDLNMYGTASPFCRFWKAMSPEPSYLFLTEVARSYGSTTQFQLEIFLRVNQVSLNGLTIALDVVECGRERMGNHRVRLASLKLMHVGNLMLFIEKLRVIVTDGITIGHPCCGVAHCSQPLEHNKDRFCHGHRDEQNICCVVNCRTLVEFGFLTCPEPNHRALDTQRQMGNKAFFQLRDRLARQKVTHPDDAFSAQAHDDVVDELHLREEERDPACEGKDENGKRRICARFGRRHSHNEQILVRPCGIIVARTTFFGSETTPQTVVS